MKSVPSIVVLLAMQILLSGCGKETPPAKAPIISSPAISTVRKVKVETLAAKKDLVCNMALEPEVAFTLKQGEKTYGFCSAYCKGEFEKGPKKYLDAAAAAPGAGNSDQKPRH